MADTGQIDEVVSYQDCASARSLRGRQQTTGSHRGNGISSKAKLTPDGRLVVFESAATDLVTNDTAAATDVFVRDLQSGMTTLVSVNWQGTDSGAPASVLDSSTDPMITPDGRFVAYQSTATNLVSLPTVPRSWQVYVRDTLLGTNLLVSVSPTGEYANDDSDGQLISADGRYMVFQSRASNLAPGFDTNGIWSIYRRDLIAGTTIVLAQQTPTTLGTNQPPQPIYSPRSAMAMSGDGYPGSPTPHTKCICAI